MHGIILAGCRDYSKEILIKNRYSLPSINIHTNLISLLQLKSIYGLENQNYIYIKNKAKKRLHTNIHKKHITIIGTWFINDNENKNI